jgi:dipeptidyl aminopeptidase/acylaminoacyl peptidase
MTRSTGFHSIALVVFCLAPAQAAEFTNSQAQQRSQLRAEGKVYKAQIAPHWFANSARFWYRNDGPDDAKEFVLVNAERGIREPAFDHAKLASSLSKAAGVEYVADKLPFDEIAFGDNSDTVRFSIGGRIWTCDLSSYECTKAEAKAEDTVSISDVNDRGAEPQRRRRGGRSENGTERERTSERSPDGKWIAFVEDHNLFIKPGDDEANKIQLSKDGKEGLTYGALSWSPDSKMLVAFRIEPGDRKEVYLIQSSPAGGGRAKLQTRRYALPGDKFTTYELNVFDVSRRTQTKPEVDRFEHEWLAPQPRWSKDGSHFAYEQTDRGHQRFRVINVDCQTGAARNVIDERARTFVWTAHTEGLNLRLVNWLERTEEIIYASESNGWRQLYLIDVGAGKLKNAITQGEWVVRGIDSIDETNRQVWFRASSVYPGQDPYLIHFGRVNFDGSALKWLTEGNGNHSIQYSPDRRFFIDTWSRVDLAPVNELRRASDGRRICALEEADTSELKFNGWQAPEVFVVKGRDNETDIWGIIVRPANFDPDRKYPVIEDIYAGPQGAFVPKTFSARSRYSSLTSLGFVVVKIDGMGTAHRSKAFHDVCWHNLKDAGFEDRIRWIKAAAEKYHYLDLTRVGIYGNSAGGQNAAAAVLFYPEFYKAAVASCGCHDNRMDKASWNEQWMGHLSPDRLWSKDADNWYSQSSNIDNAHRLRGKLFLIVGEMDDNVPPESTLRFAHALIKAGKDFDLLVIPGGGHGMGGAYGQRRMEDFFVRHLLNQEPPDRNAEIQPADAVNSRRQ